MSVIDGSGAIIETVQGIDYVKVQDEPVEAEKKEPST
jgi:hypothetical protein